MADEQEGGGIRQAIRFVIDKSGLRQLYQDAKEAGETAGAQIAQALDGPKVKDAIRRVGDQVAATTKDLGTKIAQGVVSGVTSSTPQLLSAVKSQVGLWKHAWDSGIDSVKDKMKNWGTLVNVPGPQPVSLSQNRQAVNTYGKGTQGYLDEIKRLQLAAQIANTTLTPLGNLLQKIGINAYQSSPKLQAMTAQLKSIGTSSQSSGTWLSGMSSQLTSLLGPLAGVAKGFGLLISAQKAFQFLQESTRVAGENQSAWARLSVTLSDFGQKLSQRQTQIMGLVGSMRSLGFSETDSVEALGTLIQLTGDYNRSLRGVTVVADLVVGRHMSMEQASKMVARATMGDVGALSRYGIVLDETRDALDQLTERMGGEAQARMNTWAGQTKSATSLMVDFKTAIGNALIAGATADGRSPLTETMTLLVKLAKENTEMFEALGFFARVTLTAAFYIVLTPIYLMSKAVKGVMAIIGTLYTDIIALPVVFRRDMNLAVASIADAATKAIKLWDRVFHTSHEGFAQMAKDARAAASVANHEFEQLKDNWQMGLGALFNPPEEGGPKAPDGAPGTAGIIKAREHQMLNSRIHTLGATALHGDADAAAEANQKLTGILDEQQKKLEEMKATEESIAVNRGNIEKTEKHIADIKKIQLDYEKRISGEAEQRKLDAHRSTEIERLGRITRQGGDQDRVKAAGALTVLEKTLTAERDKQTKYSERYWLLQDMIDKIEQQRLTTATDAEDKYKKSVEHLADRIKYHVEENQAQGELRVMMDEINKQREEANKITDQGVRLERLRVLAVHAALVETAMNTDEAIRNKRIQEDLVKLQDPATRKEAERDLLKIRGELKNLEHNRKTLGMDIVAIVQKELEITEALTAVKEIDLGQTRKQLQAAESLAKHYNTRPQALKIYQEQLDKVNKELSRDDISEDRRNQDIALKEKIERAIRAVETPINTLYSDIKEVFEEELPDIIARGAETAADKWVSSIELMTQSSRNFKKGITGMFQGLGKSYAKEMADVAKVKVKEHIAESVSEGARAFGALGRYDFGAAASHFKSALAHLASAAKWGVLAGAASSLAGGAGGGGGRDSNTGKQADTSKPMGPDLYIHIDGVDPKNPRHQELIGQTQQQYTERTGGSVYVTSR